MRGMLARRSGSIAVHAIPSSSQYASLGSVISVSQIAAKHVSRARQPNGHGIRADSQDIADFGQGKAFERKKGDLSKGKWQCLYGCDQPRLLVLSYRLMFRSQFASRKILGKLDRKRGTNAPPYMGNGTVRGYSRHEGAQ
jgi:hypothetical protein